MRLGVKCPGYVQSLRWVNKCEVLDDSTKEETWTKEKSPTRESSDSPKRLQFADEQCSPKQTEARHSFQSPKRSESNSIDALLHTPLFGDDLNQSAGQDTSQGIGLPDTGDLCDNLWDLGGDSSLPELADLCPRSPESISLQQDDLFDFGSTTDNPTEPPCLFSSGLSRAENGNTNTHEFQDFSPSAIVRNYPPNAPKLPNPNPNIMTISRPLNNPSWTLIEYYFKEVAALFSSYDSQMNPFRSTVSRLWGSSLAMCRTMQSMAAATLVNDFPQFGPMGLKMRDEAVDIITKEAVMDDKSLLALLMLGQTASWHNPTDLGISFFNLLRKHFNTLPNETGLLKNTGNDYRFFEESLIYWEMLLSFVADDDAVALSGVSGSGMEESIVLQRVPHPWTGIARDAQYTLQEVGRLVRSERKRVRTRNFTSKEDIAKAHVAIERANELEGKLLNLAHPSEAEIVSPGDDDTPVWHLLTIAEVYRCTGLMQLYRVFPDLLSRRLALDRGEHNRQGSFSSSSTTTNENTAFSDPLMDISNGFYDPFLNFHSNGNTATNASHSHSQTSTTIANNWLTEFALTTLSRLKTIPQESRTRCLQPLLLVASCSELRLPPSSSTPSHAPLNNPAPDSVDVSSHAIEISQSRKFILGRLTSLLHCLPPKPIEVCLRIVNEVWRRMDRGEEGVYWMDVVIERGWETTMG